MDGKEGQVNYIVYVDDGLINVSLDVDKRY